MAPKGSSASDAKNHTKAKLTSKKASINKGKKQKKRTENFSSYLFHMLKYVHPDLSITKPGMSVLNSFISDMFERLATESGHLAQYSKKRTMSGREIQSAVRLLLPGELANHAISEAGKAMMKYANSE